MKKPIKQLSNIMVCLSIIGILACQQQSHNGQQAGTESTVEKAIAVLNPTKDNSVSGVVTFTKLPEGIKVTSNITGLTPGKHGFHIHEFGDCSSEDGLSAGAHFNPTQMAHGAPTDTQRHSGDFGNIIADSTGTANMEWIDLMITFEGPHSIIGRAVIVHALEDDLKSQPTGAAGARIACGVIGVDDNK